MTISAGDARSGNLDADDCPGLRDTAKRYIHCQILHGLLTIEHCASLQYGEMAATSEEYTERLAEFAASLQISAIPRDFRELLPIYLLDTASAMVNLR